jgi:hypothetical protein
VTGSSHLFTDADEPPPKVEGRYVCAQCGQPGVPDRAFKPIDPRYATGLCTGSHKGQQYLVREDVLNTERKKKPRKR